MQHRAILSLETGEHFFGYAHGPGGEVGGEVVFNTSMTGYQEITTDPSYRGQIVVLAYPLINNYGANRHDPESRRPWLAGLVVREHAERASNWRNQQPLSEFLSEFGIPVLSGIDTRRLVRILRSGGVRKGLLSRVEGDVPDCDRFAWITGRAVLPDRFLTELQKRAAAVPALSAQHLIEEVTYGRRYEFESGPWDPWPAPETRPSRPRIALLDTGAKSNIARSLAVRGCRISVLPYGVSAAEVDALRPDGVVLANGPGDPEAAVRAVETVGALIERYPLMGICLGHQVLGLAIGAKTSRLKFGHRGSNHPVKELASGRVCITAQNHGFQVEAESIPESSGFAVSHLNLNDGSVEGLAHRDLPVFSVQYHPEAAPGPQDNQHLFDRFLDLVESR
ncbi:MAG: glutamine-hydrolyzing carbamoyl-phosphate synthase small subunit [Chloroflexi bacterium]|nr:glutamine-hydrolyzing carbamoyl-phosphate synthase small subunit [Chloroflexota bacterium]